MRITKRHLRRIIKEQLVIDKTVPDHFGDGENINVYDYDTKNFDVCATAVKLFDDDLADAKFPGTQQLIAAAAKIADKIFGLEKSVVKKGFSTYEQVEESAELHEEFKALIKDVLVTDFSDKIAFMKMHISEITKREE
tara:strand:+ start:263 stop:676 length:414 start_codon:yes stop_codon:yes gene_type:complete